MTAVCLCTDVMAEFESFLQDLEKDLGRAKGLKHWARLKVVFKEKVLINMIGRLERAKSMLGLALLILSRH